MPLTLITKYAIWPQRFIFMGIYFAISKREWFSMIMNLYLCLLTVIWLEVYVNSLLASLNARNSLRGQTYEASTMPNGVDTPIVFPMNTTSTSTSTKERYSGSAV